MSKRFTIVIALTVTGVMALAAAALAGQTVGIDSKVTFAIGCAHQLPNGGCDRVRIHGRVEASKHACEVRRTVKYFRRFSGELVGKDKTDDDGKWQLVQSPDPGSYYANVRRREVDIAGTTFVCRRDRSSTFSFH